MDPNIIHYLINGLLTLLIAVLSWIGKNYAKRIADLEADLVAHKLQDSAEFAKLNVKSDEVARRLESIEAKLDRIIENRKLG